jgi:hypothetical protein
LRRGKKRTGGAPSARENFCNQVIDTRFAANPTMKPPTKSLQGKNMPVVEHRHRPARSVSVLTPSCYRFEKHMIRRIRISLD